MDDDRQGADDEHLRTRGWKQQVRSRCEHWNRALSKNSLGLISQLVFWFDFLFFGVFRGRQKLANDLSREPPLSRTTSLGKRLTL